MDLDLLPAINALAAKIQLLTDFLVTIQPASSAFPYARDANDNLRISLTASPAVVPTETEWLAANSYTVWYSTGAPTSMDAREQQTEASIASWILTRQRWTFS